MNRFRAAQNMTEKYVGVKFKTIFQSKIPPINSSNGEILAWCKKFDRLGLAPRCGKDSAGNLSFRTLRGFIITPAAFNFEAISEDDLVEVVGCNIQEKTVTAIGRWKPSSESMLHYSIYSKRNDVNAIFHGHDQYVLKYSKKLGLTETLKEQPYGSVELIKEALKVLEESNYIVLKNHGFISLGENISAAGKLALKMHKKALAFHNSHKVDQDTPTVRVYV